MPGTRGDVAPNDTGLPAAGRSELAKQAELWCKYGSWSMCRSCGSMDPRIFAPQDPRRAATPTAAKCSKCTRNIYVPRPEDVPEALKNLSEKAVRALRPLDVDAGSNVRAVAGYRVHDAMINSTGRTRLRRRR